MITTINVTINEKAIKYPITPLFKAHLIWLELSRPTLQPQLTEMSFPWLTATRLCYRKATTFR